MKRAAPAVKRHRAIFISDVHLGTRDCQAGALLDFLRRNECEQLFLVGDIIDGWSLKRKMYWPQSHSDVVQKILRQARKATRVCYVIGNHDEFIREFVPLQLGDHLHIVNECEYIDARGRRIGVIHGDSFDSITLNRRWLAKLGDVSYQLLLRLNRPINWLRRRIGCRRYWSLAAFVKQRVKQSVQFIDNYEQVLCDYASQHRYAGIVSGHIHHAEIRRINDVVYMNCGDWVESCTALVESQRGEWRIVRSNRLH